MSDCEPLLRRLADVDPWGPEDSEYGSSSCHYCGSGRKAKYGEPDRFEHYSSCVWMAAADHLSLGRAAHVFYVPPPLEPPCPECGFQQQNNEELLQLPGSFYGPESTGTLDDHHLHMARAAGFDTIAEWFAAERRDMWKAMTVSVLRGGIAYVNPYPPIGEAQRLLAVTQTESGLVVVSENTIPQEANDQSEAPDDPDH